jgi:glycosyltransferase involved in cell wall biosynthesis
MTSVRQTLRDLLPPTLRERYHLYALKRDFGIDRRNGTRQPTRLDARRQPGLNVIGYFDSPGGIGQSTRSLADAAERAGIRVAREKISRYGHAVGSAPYDVNLYHANADGAAALVEELGPRLHSGRANVGYWYWETETLPPEWRDRFDYFDEIWVATEYCERAVALSSSIPVFRVPPAVEPAAARTGPKAWAGVDSADFLFLSVVDALSVPERKNPVGTVRAFARAFPTPSSAHLLLQISNIERTPGLSQELASAAAGTRVTIRTTPLPRPDLENLFAACDAYVSLHRAEGFGFPIAEAMAAGKPVVATDYSGSADYLDETTGFPVRWKYMELPRTIRDYARGTRWAEADEAHAAELLRRVFEDHDEAARRADRGRRRVFELYSSSAVGRRIAERLDALRLRLPKSA